MVPIVAVREAEQWSATNLFFGVVLLGVAIIALVWAIRRYLGD